MVALLASLLVSEIIEENVLCSCEMKEEDVVDYERFHDGMARTDMQSQSMQLTVIRAFQSDDRASTSWVAPLALPMLLMDMS